MSFTSEIEKYEVSYDFPGSTIIQLYNLQNQILARIEFAPTFNQRKCIPTSHGGFDIQAPLTELSSVIDLLRNEKPLYFRGYSTLAGHIAYLSTSKEPVGEEESTQVVNSKIINSQLAGTRKT